MVVSQHLDLSDVPRPLRQFRSFKKIPDRALDVARRALDDDDDFRARLRDALDEDAVGRAGWLVLDRPDGWEDDLADLVAEVELDEVTAALRADNEQLKRDLARARDVADGASEVVARLEADLAEAQQARDDLEARLAAATDEVARLGHERAQAVRSLEQEKDRSARRVAEVRTLSERVGELETELAELRDQVAAKPQPAGLAEPVAPVDPVEPADISFAGEPSSSGGPDLEALSQLVADASSAAQALASALAKASHVLHPSTDDEPERASTAPSSSTRGRARSRARRRPTPLPLGVLDDSVDAARHLISVEGMVLLVDGYNVTLRNFGDLPIDLQRGRLVDALSALSARSGVEVVVVFDTAEEVHAAPLRRARSVQVQFTPVELEADDVLLDAIDRYPHDRPVTVVSSDGRVREGARRKGANVLTSEQLAALFS